LYDACREAVRVDGRIVVYTYTGTLMIFR